MRFHLLPAAGLLLATTVAFGEEPPISGFGERIDVRLVQVDAWATDSGRPVLDLRQDELRLSEDGKPIQILYFSAPIAGASAPDAAAPTDDESDAAASAPEEQVVVAIYLDDAHLSGAARAKAVDAVKEWLGDGLPASAELLVVSYDQELRVIVPRTHDRARVLAALEAARNPSTRALEAQIDLRQTIERIREEQRNGLERMRGSVDSGGTPGEAEDADDSLSVQDVPCTQRLLQQAEDLADRAEHDAKGALDAMASFVDSLAALGGRKLMLFVSEGLSLRPGGSAFDYVRALCDGSGMREGLQYAMDVGAQFNGHMLEGQLNPSALALAGETRSLAGLVSQIVARANSSGVTVWSLGARGLTPSGDDAGTDLRSTTPAATARERAEADDLLTAVAADTGGRAILDSNDLGGALETFSDDLFRAYSIAFTSPRSGDGKLHAVRLETTRQGVSLRYRRSWRDSSTEEELASLVGGALDYGVERQGLGATMTVGRQRGGASGTAGRLILRLTLPRSALASVPDSKGGERGLLRVVIALRTADGEATPARAKLIEIGKPTDGGEGPLVHDIALPEIGRGSLVAVGLRDEVSGEIGVFRVEVGGS